MKATLLSATGKAVSSVSSEFCECETTCVLLVPGCPGAKKNEFLTSVLDALSTDMVHAVSDPSSSGRYVARDTEWVLGGSPATGGN